MQRDDRLEPRRNRKPSPDEVIRTLTRVCPTFRTREDGLRAMLAILTLLHGEEPTRESTGQWLEALLLKYPETRTNHKLTMTDFVNQALFTRDAMRGVRSVLEAEESEESGERR